MPAHDPVAWARSFLTGLQACRHEQPAGPRLLEGPAQASTNATKPTSARRQGGDRESADGRDLSVVAGVIPRAIHQIFAHLESISSDCTVKCSFLELYNEELTDLLFVGAPLSPALPPVRHSQKGSAAAPPSRWLSDMTRQHRRAHRLGAAEQQQPHTDVHGGHFHTCLHGCHALDQHTCQHAHTGV